MVSCTQSVDQSDCGVDDSLQWRYGGVWQPDKQSVTIVEPRENECGDKIHAAAALWPGLRADEDDKLITMTMMMMLMMKCM